MLIRQDLLQAIQLNTDLMKILIIIRNLGLKDSWLAAGSIRNFIWNLLSDKSPFDRETDVDVIFFDPDISYEETVSLEKKLREDFPQYQWELKNQVYMHQHSPHTVPYTSSRDAMSKYPERCTAIGLRLHADATIELFAPYGLEDILNFQASPTPHFLENEDLSRTLVQEKLARKMEKSHFFKKLKKNLS